MRRVPSNDEQHTQRSAAFDSGSLLKDGSILPQAAVPALDPRGMDLLSEIGSGCYQDQGVARFVMLCNLLIEERDVVERVSRGGAECTNESPPGLTPLVSKTCETGIATGVQDIQVEILRLDINTLPVGVFHHLVVFAHETTHKKLGPIVSQALARKTFDGRSDLPDQ